jgi:hypothetical protein
MIYCCNDEKNLKLELYPHYCPVSVGIIKAVEIEAKPVLPTDMTTNLSQTKME